MRTSILESMLLKRQVRPPEDYLLATAFAYIPSQPDTVELSIGIGSEEFIEKLSIVAHGTLEDYGLHTLIHPVGRKAWKDGSPVPTLAPETKVKFNITTSDKFAMPEHPAPVRLGGKGVAVKWSERENPFCGAATDQCSYLFCGDLQPVESYADTGRKMLARFLCQTQDWKEFVERMKIAREEADELEAERLKAEVLKDWMLERVRDIAARVCPAFKVKKAANRNEVMVLPFGTNHWAFTVLCSTAKPDSEIEAMLAAWLKDDDFGKREIVVG